MSEENHKHSADVLEQLYGVIESRKGADPETSYTARLFDEGRERISGKVTEEAAETVYAAMSETPERLASESADVLYHLLVLWADAGIRPEDVWAELAKRQGTSGIDEKNARSPEV